MEDAVAMIFHDILLQDTTLFCHAKDMRLFEGVSSDQEALDLARSDSDEHFVKKVVGHSGDPSKLKSFRIHILFDDDSNISYLPLRAVKFVPLVREYVMENPDLRSSSNNPKTRIFLPANELDLLLTCQSMTPI